MNTAKIKLLVTLALGLVTAVFFQNCGGGFTATSGGDFAALSSVAENFDLIFDAKSGTHRTDTFNRVESFTTAGQTPASLHPPFSGSSSRLNMDVAPTLVDNALQFTPQQYLELSRYDLPKTYSNAYTIGVVVSDLTITNNSYIRILDLAPIESADVNGHIYLQAERVTVNGQVIFRFHAGIWFNTAGSRVKTFNVSEASLKNKNVIMLVVPPEVAGFRLIVNGVEHTSNTQGDSGQVGNPPNLARNIRTLLLNNPGAPGGMKLHSLFVSLAAFNSNEITLSAGGISSREGLGSSGGRIGPAPTTADTGPITHKQLMSAGPNGVFGRTCVGCHSQSLPLGGLNIDDPNQARMKINKIIDRMEGRGAIMPQTGALPAAQINIVKAWRDSGMQ